MGDASIAVVEDVPRCSSVVFAFVFHTFESRFEEIVTRPLVWSKWSRMCGPCFRSVMSRKMMFSKTALARVNADLLIHLKILPVMTSGRGEGHKKIGLEMRP